MSMKRNKNTLRFGKQLTAQTFWQKPWFWLAGIIVLALVAILILQIPSINDRANFHSTRIRSKIHYFFKPPEQIVFVPSESSELSEDAIARLTEMAPTVTPTLMPTETPVPVAFLEDTPTPTIVPTNTPIPTPLPAKVMLEGIEPEAQGFNNCGPTNLSMALGFWGWEGDQFVTEKVLKPFRQDRNVMPYEMIAYVNQHTEYGGIVRYGGNLELVKELVANGFPVIIERGYMDAREGWMGHYGIIAGYDDEKQEVTIPDSYLGWIKMSYEEISMYWAQFDDIYMVIFPYEREEEVREILGQQMDDNYNKQYALDQVTARLYTTKDRELFFAWYSRGSILVEMQDYWGAAESYDKAFEVYNKLPEKDRPWRVTWYQTGPMFAYYYMGRYTDVYNLAKQTLDKATEPALPESWVWLGRAEVKRGNQEAAIAAFRQALKWHPGWWVAENELIALGQKVD